MYVDDTTIYFNLEDFDPCVEAEISKELEKLNFWMNLNKSSLNTQKTKLMIFHRKQKKVREINLSIDNNQIEQVSVFNFLGIILDEKLGPLLFILQMNDLTNSSKLLFAILFADDTSVFLEGKEYTHLIEMLNSELKKLTIWLNVNKLTVNVKKTHYMVFH